jgi:hypothetical protein
LFDKDDELLTELEAITRQMIAPEVGLEQLDVLCERRAELLDLLLNRRNFDRAWSYRLRGVIDDGEGAKLRIAAIRDFIVDQMSNIEKNRCFVRELRSTLTDPSPSLDVQG